jgi:hypothetical protein
VEVRRGWVKVHIAVDTKTNRLVGLEVTDESVGDKSGIKTRVDASTQSRGSPYRARCVRERKWLGYKKWRDRHGHGMRWKPESFNSGVKRTFGEYVRLPL